MAYTPITIGGITLDGLEIPEVLESVGGFQSVVRHEYAGGLITLRNLGAFPHPVSLRGLLTGAGAFDRMYQLERLMATAQLTVLAWGPVQLQGEVTEFEARPRHQYLIPYTLRFEPVLDLTGVVASPAVGAIPSAENQLSSMSGAMGTTQNGTGSTLPTAAGGLTGP